MLVHVLGSAFASQSLQTPSHLEAQWQVATSLANIGLGVFVEDTWFTAVWLNEFQFTFDTLSSLYVRVRYRDNLGIISEWSEPLHVFTLSTSQRRTLEEAWAFTLDGHIFYVLNFALEAALIYDLTAKQWYRWYHNLSLGDETQPYWNMFRGAVWKGRVLAADIETAKIWEMDPLSMLDDATLPIKRVVTGFQPLRGSGSVRQGALRVIARKENAAAAATVSMRYSDDNGKTWSLPRTVVLAANSYSQRLEFRSLGRIRAPGRLWEIEDSGGFVRIDGADMDLEGAE